jgi:hypothetical protein
MAYVPLWERLADALKRVMAAGASEAEAKADLCHAMADRKIGVRIRIAGNADYDRGKLFSRGNVSVPSHLVLGDFDWERSRPLKPWAIGPMPGQHYAWLGWKDHPIDLIELWTADVAEVLGVGARANESAREASAATVADETAAIPAPQAYFRSNPAPSRGKPPKYDYDQIRGQAFRLFKGHGIPSRNGEKGWQTRADLERKLAEFCNHVFGEEPAKSTLQGYAKKALADWAEHRADNSPKADN